MPYSEAGEAWMKQWRKADLQESGRRMTWRYGIIRTRLRRGRRIRATALPETEEKNIDILPTGPTPPNPVELLGSENNRKLLERLKKKYDIIIMDCAPVIGLSDAVILAKISDVNLITVSCKKTKMENLERVEKLFDQNDIKINGVILNKAQMQGNGYYSYYYNNEYYGDGKKRK